MIEKRLTVGTPSSEILVLYERACLLLSETSILLTARYGDGMPTSSFDHPS